MTERATFTEAKELQFRNALISILSHDAKGLLANVFWLIEAIEGGLATPDMLHELIIELKSTADKTAELFNETIAWVKNQQNGFSVNKEYVGVHKLYERLKLYFLPGLAGKQMQLIFSGNTEEVLFTDNAIITFILKYIIQAAINFSENGKNIIFKTEKNRQLIEIAFFENKNNPLLPHIIFGKCGNDSLPQQKPDIQSKYTEDFLNLLKGTIEATRHNNSEIKLRLSLPL